MRRMTDAAVSMSGILFGLITWSLAHALTYLLFAHIHEEPVRVVHVHGGAWPIVIATVGLLAASTLAGVAARLVLRLTRAPRARPTDGPRPGAMAAAGAPAVFVVIELAQHVASGDEGPPATLLIIGVVLHTAMGALTPLLWTGFVRPTVRAILVRGVAPTGPNLQRQPVDSGIAGWTASRYETPRGSRGPPHRRGISIIACSA